MKSLALVAGLLVGTAAQAAEPDCSAPATQLDLSRCAAAALTQLDAELDAAYAEAAARLGDAGPARTLLADALPTEGGSIQPMVVANCRADRTRARLATVRSWLACPEGDLACPLPPKAP